MRKLRWSIVFDDTPTASKVLFRFEGYENEKDVGSGVGITLTRRVADFKQRTMANYMILTALQSLKTAVMAGGYEVGEDN